MLGKIVISGGTGFVGQNLTSYLSNFKVKVLSRNDLLSKEAIFEDCEIFVHLAGKAHDLKKVALPSEYYEVNFELTKNLYNEFLKSNAKKFIFVSTVKAAADAVEGVLDEDFIPNPITYYGKSKLKAEQYIQAQRLPEGKSYYILRPCMIHGPGNKGNLNLLYNIIEKGIPYPLASFDNKRSFLSVENLCFVIKQLIITDDVQSGIYMVADDESLSTNEVVNILAEATGKKPKLLSIPVKLIKALARIGDFLRLPLNSERLQKLTENYIVSNTKIKKTLKIEFPVSAIDGLRRTCISFKKNL